MWRRDSTGSSPTRRHLLKSNARVAMKPGILWLADKIWANGTHFQFETRPMLLKLASESPSSKVSRSDSVCVSFPSPSMTTSIRVGVALFSKSASAPDPYFSWAIATTEGAWAEGEVVVYDIALGAKSRRWEPRARRGVYLREEEAFCGVLEFATTDIPGEDLDEFIRDHPSDDDGWRVCGPAGWATAMWTLKIMCSLEDAAIWEIPMEYGVDGLFDVIIGKAFEMLEIVDEFPVLSL